VVREVCGKNASTCLILQRSDASWTSEARLPRKGNGVWPSVF
jgi:hypothetical protein